MLALTSKSNSGFHGVKFFKLNCASLFKFIAPPWQKVSSFEIWHHTLVWPKDLCIDVRQKNYYFSGAFDKVNNYLEDHAQGPTGPDKWRQVEYYGWRPTLTVSCCIEGEKVDIYLAWWRSPTSKSFLLSMLLVSHLFSNILFTFWAIK